MARTSSLAASPVAFTSLLSPLAISNAHSQPISCLAVDEDGSLLVSAGEDGTIAVFPILQILDASLSKNDSAFLALYKISAHDLAITGIALGSGVCNRAIVSSSLDGTCKFWSMANGAHLRTVQFMCEIWCVVVDVTSMVAYAGGSDGRVQVIQIIFSGRKPGVEVVAWGPEQSRAVTAVAMANGNENLVSTSEDGILRIHDVDNGAVLSIFGQERVGGFGNLLLAKVIGSHGITIRNECVGANWDKNVGFSQRENFVGTLLRRKWMRD